MIPEEKHFSEIGWRMIFLEICFDEVIYETHKKAKNLIL